MTWLCVDQYESIFMVCHNTWGKVNPVHCQKKTHGQTTNVMCEVTDCINAIQVATRSNINHFECAHMKSISKSIGHQQTNQLKDDLENLSSTGQFYMFSDKSLANLKTIRNECFESNTVPTVQFPCEEDSRFWFFSVVKEDKKKKYYARLERCIVEVDRLTSQVDCSCCTLKRLCEHKMMELSVRCWVTLTALFYPDF